MKFLVHTPMPAVLALLLSACATSSGPSANATSDCATPTTVEVLLNAEIRFDGVSTDLDGLRERVQRLDQACPDGPVPIRFGVGGNELTLAAPVLDILREELPSFELTDVFIHSTPIIGAPEPTPAERQAQCDRVPFDIIVWGDERATLNGAEIGLIQLRYAAEEKAIACRGATPTGTYEGPNHVTVIASMIWPILREELPDLELEMSRRGP